MLMNRKIRNIIILLVLFLLVILGYIGIRYMNAAEASTEEETISLFGFSVSDIEKVSFSSEGSLESLSFSYEEESWSYDGDENFPLDGSYIDTIVSNSADLQAVRELQEGLDNLEDYGLETPLYTLKLTTSDATEYEVYIGNMNAVSGNYYAYTSLEEKVYMIDSTLPDSLSYELYDMVVYDTIPSLSSSNVESVIYKDTDTNLELNMIAEDNGQYDYTDSLSWFVKSGETYEMADSAMVSELFSTIGTFAFAECIDYNAEETEKEVYGLNSTQTSLQISYTDSETEEEGEFVLYIGGNSPDGNYYVGTSLSEAVYIMSADLITPFLEIQTADLMNKSLFLVSSSSVDSIQISSTEGEWEIAISRTEDEEGDVQSSYTLNGNTMDSENLMNSIVFLRELTEK
jgi:hypothetical protein